MNILSFSKLSLMTSVLMAISSNSNLALAETTKTLDTIDNYSQSNSNYNQVNSVSQLKDVLPTDWVYEALRSLVERYGCIVGYPDRTYRGNRSLSRYEFAAGLNACLQQMERLIAQSEAVLREDLEILKRLMKEFENELVLLGTRVDNLESRVAFLEDHQFSTTTKLSGEVVLGLSNIFTGEKNGGRDDIESVAVLGDRIRLELNTSFTGKDLLYTRLATGNFPDYLEVAGTQQASLAFAQPDGNDVALEVLNYSFPLTENITLWIEGAGGAFDDFTDTLSIIDGDGGSGALSSFGTRNLVYYQGEGAGLALQGNFGSFGWSAGYLATEGNNPEPGKGLFNGAYGLIGQLGFYPHDDFGIAFTYGHGYNTFAIAENTRSFAQIAANLPISTSHNTYALTMSWKIADSFVLGSWGGYSTAKTLNSLTTEDDIFFSRGSANFWYWAVTLGFPDLFWEGSTGGIIVGMQPWATNNTIKTNSGDLARNDDTSFHLEAFYEYALNDNISITPGVVVVTNPDNDSRNSTLVIGTIRTTFTF